MGGASIQVFPRVLALPGAIATLSRDHKMKSGWSTFHSSFTSSYYDFGRKSHPYQLNLRACLASFLELLTCAVSARGDSPADRPNLFRRGSDGGTETGTSSLTLHKNNKPPVLPTLSCLVMSYGGFQGRHERGQALTGTPPFRPWTFPECSPLRQ
jgi:hypothetical protein